MIFAPIKKSKIATPPQQAMWCSKNNLRRAVYFTTSGLALGLCIHLPAVGNTKAISYSFTKIADSRGSYGDVGANAINNRGEVVFGANAGIFISDKKGNIALVAPARTSQFEDFNGLAINDKGTVAFGAFLPTGGNGIFTSQDGRITTIATTSSTFDFVGLPGTINNKGTVSFGAFVSDGSSNFTSAIYTGDGGSLNAIADTSGPYSFFDQPFAPINDSGTVAFEASLDAGGFGIFTRRGTATTKITDSSGPLSFGSPQAINKKGTVALLGTLDSGAEGVFTSDGGQITTIADSSGSFNRFFNASLNDRGDVVFAATLDLGSTNVFADGIYTGPDPIANKVIAVGDSLLGSKVTNVFVFPGALNNSGQISFLADVTDSNGVTTTGVFRAEPVP